MRILFMGTPDFAVPCMERLIADGHEVVGAVTQPDKPKNRVGGAHPYGLSEYVDSEQS